MIGTHLDGEVLEIDDTAATRVFMMSGKCVNNACSAHFHGPNEGKLFRIDIEIGSNSGGDERKIEYIWLCGRCARTMNPKIEVAGNVLTVRLLAIEKYPAGEDYGSANICPTQVQ